MGYVARYRKEAQEKALPDWQHFVIAEIEKTGEAILGYRNPHGSYKNGKWVVAYNPHPEMPMLFPSYEDAFAYLSSKLTTHAPDVWYAPVQMALFAPEALPTSQALSQPTSRR